MKWSLSERNQQKGRRDTAYLVTGGTGHIGSRIIRKLIQEGESVVAYERNGLPQGSLLERLLGEETVKRVEIVQGEITDLPHLMRTVKDNNIDTVIHMAALLKEASRDNPLLAIKVNCEGTANVFETARILGLRKVVWASSNAIFGPSEKHVEGCIATDAPHYPASIYAACKSFNENIAAHYFEHYGVDVSAIRYLNVYGAGQRRGSIALITQELIENPAIGKPGRVPLGDETLAWLYVDDAATAAFLLSKADKTKTRAFNIGGDIRSVRQVADYVKQLLPKADITLLPGGRGLVSDFDTAPLEAETGYRPQWTIERGITDMINTVRRWHDLPPL